MAKLFSQRVKQPNSELRYDFAEDERSRILHIVRQVGRDRLQEGLKQLEALLRRTYGSLVADGSVPASDAVIKHFYHCNMELALDFIEGLFHVDGFWGDRDHANLSIYAGEMDMYVKNINSYVTQINEIFLECGLGFELTPFALATKMVRVRNSTKELPLATFEDAAIPQIILKSSQYEHERIVKPALEFLRDPRFHVANSEILAAHEDFRHLRFNGAITSCGSAFESVLKTICDLKGWPYDPDRDTVSKLIGICRENGLFPGFYAPIFEAAGTVRNKLSDGHGRGPDPLYEVNQSNAEHMIQMTSAHILLIVKLAVL